jgi:predicted flap endonuclease-1-like 5' DNA nuclease
MYVEIENTKTGQRKTISQRTWELMANSRDRGDTRKGYKLIKGGDTKAVAAKVAAVKTKTPTMIPPAIQAAADAALEAERAAEATMMSGAKGEAVAVEAAPEPAPAPDPTPEPEVTSEPDPVPEAPAEPVEVQHSTELSGLDESLTPKVAQVLAAAGISTFAQLNAATLPTINKALDAAGLGAKKAQAPGWKSKAKTRVTK